MRFTLAKLSERFGFANTPAAIEDNQLCFLFMILIL